MAYKLVGRSWNPSQQGFTDEYIADTEADVADLPECITGSTALVVESGAVYMVNASGVWAEFGG